MAAADAEQATAAALPDAADARRIIVVGAGKAAAAMARGAERGYDMDPRLEGIVITRYGHALPTRVIEVIEAGHPVPDAAGAAGTERIVELVEGAGPDDLVLCLISGGGSASLSAPLGIDAGAMARLTESLLVSGATIAEFNAVRKHLSRVKGGRLALAAAPARVVTLVVSDVVGDDPSDVASGPTAADPTTFADAIGVLERYGIDDQGVRDVLERGLRGELPETPKPGDPRLAGQVLRVIASNQRSLEAAAAVVEAHGYAPHVLSSTFDGDAAELARVHAAIVRQVLEHGQPFARPCALLSGGETTVTVRGDGRGGRNGEFALALAAALPAGAPVWLLAADSDGIDGSETNAGVVLGPELLAAVDRREAAEALARNDSFGFFTRHGGLFTTGPTRTNVNDIRILLIP